MATNNAPQPAADRRRGPRTSCSTASLISIALHLIVGPFVKFEKHARPKKSRRKR